MPAVPPVLALLEPFVLEPLLLEPPLLEPPVPVGGGGVDEVQEPTVEPGSRWHRPPGQQSPLIVQLPPDGTQFPPPSKQRSAPLSSGTHGTWLQQSAAEAHTSPAAWQSPTPKQRGTPKASSLHINDLGVSGPQQSERAEELLQA